MKKKLLNHRPLYQQIVNTVVAYKNCERLGNLDWMATHEQWLKRAEDALPRGSGIDSGCEIDVEASNENKLVINSSYHCMDENGFYDGWIDFKVIVKPCLLFGITIDIKGRFSDRHGKYVSLRDYLQEVFDHCLKQKVEVVADLDRKIK